MPVLSCNRFTDFLVSQTPIYDKLILEDVRPTDGFSMGYFESGTWDAYDGDTKSLDRFNHVFPNLTAKWNRVQTGSCIGTPCDKEEQRIGMGNTRTTFYMEEQSWSSDLFCFDEIMHVNKARENFSYFISDVLRPTSIWVTSNFLRKRAADHAGKKWVANAAQSDFTFTWDAGENDIYITTTAEPTSLLTPQMLQRRVQPLINKGYLGKNIKDAPLMLELSTDLDTLWQMNRNSDLADTSNLAEHWRFMEFTSDLLRQYWSYGWTGRIGNYMVNVDFFPLRFNRLSANRYQVVFPYQNEAATNGIKSVDNDDYHNAQYQWSFIRHRRAINVLTFNASPVNPEMPFLVRDFGGRWRFVLDNLGADVNGCVIENKRRNKGMFIADFKLSIKPMYVEWMELIFHKREPACVVVVPTCNTDPGYPAQDYDSANDPCTDTATLYFTPTKTGATYAVDADAIKCNGVPIDHAAIAGSATLAALVTELNTKVAVLGTWGEQGDGVQIKLDDSTCTSVTIPWE